MSTYSEEQDGGLGSASVTHLEVNTAIKWCRSCSTPSHDGPPVAEHLRVISPR